MKSQPGTLGIVDASVPRSGSIKGQANRVSGPLGMADTASEEHAGLVDTMPIDALTTQIDELQDEEAEPWLHSHSLRLTDRLLVIELDIRVDQQVHSHWILECSDVVEHCFSLGSHDYLSASQDHVVLLDHVDRRADLYFSHSTSDIAKIAGALAIVHEGFMGNWRPMSHYINPSMPLQALLAHPSGQLASGPASLLAAYAEVLEFHGFTTSVLDAGVPKLWDEERGWVDVETDLVAAVFAGGNVGSLSEERGSFVVARHMCARPLTH